MDLWDLIEDVDDLRTAAREEARLRREAQTEVERLRAQLAEAWDGGAEAARRNAEIDPAVRDPERNPYREPDDAR